jgi:hypothetical protein
MNMKAKFSITKVIIRIVLAWVFMLQALFSVQVQAAQAASGNEQALASGQTQLQSNLGGCALFPADNIWNARIDSLPVNAHSTDWVNSIGRSTGFHMDFGSGKWDGGPIGIPYNVVDENTPKVTVTFDTADESYLGPYPIPATPLQEYGSDHHILIVDSSTCKLYELWAASKSGASWHAGSGAMWDLNSNALRPNGWTSADAAGLPILPGLVRYDEILSGKITHAIRFTANETNPNYFIWPARHLTDGNVSAPPMGARFRLKASFNISGYSPQMQVILQAMKTYGIILADNGSDWFVSGAPDGRWNNDMLHTLDDVTGNNFEAVDESLLMISANSGQAKPDTLTISGNAGAAGVSLKYVAGVAKTVVSDASGNYTIKVPINWSGKITPSKAGVVSFVPAFRTYTSVRINYPAQNYQANCVSTFISMAAYDGWTLESAKNSGGAGAISANAKIFAVGDDALNRQYRSILSFNTGTLPDNAVILSAKLKISKQYITGTDPMSTHGPLVMDIAKPYFGASQALGLDDFNAVPGLIYAGSVGVTPVGSIYTGPLQVRSLPYINSTGLTQLRLRFQLNNNNDNSADYMAFYSGDAPIAANWPSLEIVYYVPIP